MECSPIIVIGCFSIAGWSRGLVVAYASIKRGGNWYSMASVRMRLRRKIKIKIRSGYGSIGGSFGIMCGLV